MAKKKEEQLETLEATAVSVDDTAKFQEKVKELLELGKKRKNILEYQEIMDFFKEIPMDAEKYDQVLETLERENIDVLRMTEMILMMISLSTKRMR